MNVGVWVDHNVARLVELAGEDVRCSEIQSDVEKKHRGTGGFRMPGKNYVKAFSASEKHMDRTREEHLRRFYEDVASALGEADRIVILGPGEAKTELAKRIGRDKALAPRLAGVVTSQDMTERQLIAAVKNFFHPTRDSRCR